MSGTFPASPGFTTTNFKINNPTQTSQTFGGKIRRVGIGGGYYTFTAKFPPMPRSDAGPVIGFLAKQFGQLDSFQILLPQESYPRAAYAGSTPKVVASIAIGAKSVALTNCTPSTVVLYAGDFFKFANHTKVYMCTDTCTAGIDGTATLNFAGNVIAAVPGNTNVTVNAVPFTVILNNQVQEYEVGVDRMYSMEIDLREVF